MEYCHSALFGSCTGFGSGFAYKILSSWTANEVISFVMDETVPTLQEIQGMITLVQKAFPNQYITSNRAEIFNALHDNVLTYQGKKSLEQANRDLLAWSVMKFFPDMARKIFQNHDWKIPYSILSGLWPFMISKVKFN